MAEGLPQSQKRGERANQNPSFAARRRQSLKTPPFLSADSSDAVGWAQLWALFKPVTPFGLDAKKQLESSPFLPGDEESWMHSYELLEQDAARVDAARLDAFRSKLQSLPDISGIVIHLASQAVPTPETGDSLTVRELLLLKQFAYQVHSLSQEFSKLLDTTVLEQLCGQLLVPFGQVNQSSFSVQHVAHPAYERASEEYTKAIQKQAVAIRQWSDGWDKQFGLRPNREGYIVCKLPAKAQQAQRLRETEGVKWVQDTPFESTFLVPFSAELADIRSHIQHWQDVMEAEAQKVVSALSLQLCQRYRDWQKAVDLVADLDLRFAKVQLWQQWQSCRPTQAPSPRITGAVHPVLKRQLLNQGRTYVPLEWSLPEGASVLSGSNMGGKTLAMTVLTLCQLCAQFGLPIPARDFGTRLYSTIRFYAGANTDAPSGLSSFGTEIVQLREAWQCLSQPGGQPALYCFDEPGRSTNPLEGEALVVGLVESLGPILAESVAVVATHFAAALRQTGVHRYRVRGLRNTQSSLPKAFASEDPQSFGTDGDLDRRLEYLSSAMDYSVEPMESVQFEQEGLRIADWLGLPEAILAPSRKHLEQSASTNVPVDKHANTDFG